MLKKEDLNKVLFPNLIGEYYISRFNNYGYKRIVLSKTKESFLTVCKELILEEYKLDYILRKIKIINLTDEQKEKVFAEQIRQIEMRFFNFINDKVEDYFLHFKILPKGFVQTTIVEHPRKFRIYCDGYKSIFRIMSNEECHQKFDKYFQSTFVDLERILNLKKTPSVNFPITTETQVDITKIEACSASGFNSEPELRPFKENQFLSNLPMFYFENIEKFKENEIFDLEFKKSLKKFKAKKNNIEKEQRKILQKERNAEKRKTKIALKEMFDK